MAVEKELETAGGPRMRRCQPPWRGLVSLSTFLAHAHQPACDSHLRSISFVVLAACGIIGPLVFISSTAIATASASAYDPVSQMMSELATAQAPSPMLMRIGGFVGPGLLAMGFALALHMGLGGGRHPQPTALLVAIGGLGMIGGGTFPVGSNVSASLIHHGFMILVFISAAFAPLALFAWSRRLPAWERFGIASFAFCLLISVSIILIFLEPMQAVQGAVQRTYMLLTALWMAAAASKLLFSAWPERNSWQTQRCWNIKPRGSMFVEAHRHRPV